VTAASPLRRGGVFLSAALLLGLGFGLGCLFGDRPPRPAARDDAQALRGEVAELAAAVEAMRRTLLWMGERIPSPPARSPAAAAPVACAAPAGDGGEAPLEPEAAAQLARGRAEPRFMRGEAIVAASLARGTWTEGDVESFRALQRESPGPAWIWLMQRIDAAITEGKLRPDPALTSWH
jgi:hypothetical protein